VITSFGSLGSSSAACFCAYSPRFALTQERFARRRFQCHERAAV